MKENKKIVINAISKRFNLSAGFFAKYGKFLNALNKVSFEINENETFGLVGESGCGKTTTARCIVKMYEIDNGEIIYFDKGIPVIVNQLKKKALQQYREKVKYVFQDPAKSLNPRMTVREIFYSSLRWSSKWISKQDAENKCKEIIQEVGLLIEDLDRRPTDFSGGQRQRISIARALLFEPEVLICDEVVSALDVSVQGQILNLLNSIRLKRKITILFIAHDLKVACYFCDKIGVMYKGEIIEIANAKDLYQTAKHPYSKLLFSCVPDGKYVEQNLKVNQKEKLVEKIDYEHSCPFVNRCEEAMSCCFTSKPELVNLTNEHKVKCFLAYKENEQ